ncbi:MAG: phenylalanine--tRNA ligase subunit beta [Candidatus Micrarchaeaceae archaeon]
MVSVGFDKKRLFEILGFELDDRKLVEEIEKMGVSVEGIDKEKVSLEIYSNRPDLFSIIGFSRSLKNFLHRSKRYSYELGSDVFGSIEVEKEVSKVRPFIYALYAKLEMNEEVKREVVNSIETLSETLGRKRRKIAAGLHDLSKVRPPIRYCVEREGRFIPLGKEKEMSYEEIIREHEKGKEYGDLAKDGFLVLKDSLGAMSLIPIINSDRTKITKDTKEMLIDVTGTNEFYTSKVADILACDLMDLGAEVKRIEINYPKKKVLSPLMETERKYLYLRDIESEIGVKIGENNAVSLANKMGYRSAYEGRKILFDIPPYRADIIDEQDIIEDMAIAYGYEYIMPFEIYSSQIGQRSGLDVFEEKIGLLMRSMGFTEVMSPYLTNSEKNFKKMRIEEAQKVELEYSRESSINMLRTWIIPSLLEIAGRSQNEKMPINIFEFDAAFTIEQERPKQSYHLAALSMGPYIDFNFIKSVGKSIVSILFGKDFEFAAIEHKSFIEGRAVEVRVKGKKLGFLGEIHPEVLSNFGIFEPCSALELELLDFVEVKGR